MKKADQVHLLNRLYRAMNGSNGYDHDTTYGAYSLSNTGRLQFTSAKKTEVNIPHSAETEIHLLILRLENRNN